jgi:putrescine transport system ATP-binding protein
MPEPLVCIEKVVKQFGEVRAVDGVSLDIAHGEFFALLGPSGCGKTSLMRLIAGFETPDAGQIVIDGANMQGVPPYRRPVNMMFQSYALFPHMSVERNIAYGLVQQGMNRADTDIRVRDMLRLVRLEGYGPRRPDQLSGGQKQRVALARALAPRPKLLLLDEPLAALDRKLREETQFELMQVQRDLGIAFIIVTHDQDEAMVMAQRIALMNCGKIEQIGDPRAMYDEPQSQFAAEFIGEINLLDARVDVVDGIHKVTVETPFTCTFQSEQTVQAGVAKLAVRPERMRMSHLSPGCPAEGEGIIVDHAWLGNMSVWRVRMTDGKTINVARSNSDDQVRLFSRGDKIFVGFDPAAARVLQA